MPPRLLKIRGEQNGDTATDLVADGQGRQNLRSFAVRQLRGGERSRIIAIEPAACPSLTRGKYAYDFGDTGHLTPLVKMHTLGSTFIPPGFHAGGLRYHGMAPLVSQLHAEGIIDAEAYYQTAVFEAAVQFARTVEGEGFAVW